MYFIVYEGLLLLVSYWLLIAIASSPYWHIIHSSPILTSQTSSWNSITNIRNLTNEQQDLLQMSYGASNYLAKFQGCFKRQGWEIRAEYLFSVEGENLVFNCGPCTPPSKLVHWRWVTFEGVDSPLNNPTKSADENDDSAFKPISYYRTPFQELVLTSVKPDLSSFYCYWEDTNIVDGSTIRVISKIWTVEIVSMAHMEKVSARVWQRNYSISSVVKQRSLDLEVASTKLHVGTRWSEWSPCSRCGGGAGKRHKTGFCSVDRISPETTGRLEALKLYTLPISCSLLIDFHPDILSESAVLKSFSRMTTLNHVLGRPHTILVGYCKSKRDCVSEEDYKNKIITQLYEDFEMNGDGDLNAGKDRGLWSTRGFIALLKSLVQGVPFGWNNLSEILALVGLVALQVYVIYLVLKWRNDAQ